VFWRILLELFFVVVIVFAGAGFWGCFKSPKHLRDMLCDPAEIMRVIDHAGYDKLRRKMKDVEAPPRGTFCETIMIWEAAHYRSLSHTRNLLVFVVLAALGSSALLGLWYFTVSFFVFCLLGFAELPSSARNNNANHVILVTLNLMKWISEDAQKL
jgi:hypothetical protein